MDCMEEMVDERENTPKRPSRTPWYESIHTREGSSEISLEGLAYRGRPLKQILFYPMKTGRSAEYCDSENPPLRE